MNALTHPTADAHAGGTVLESIGRTLTTATNGIKALADHLTSDQAFAGALVDAVELMGDGDGRVVVSGVGKSGHIGRKIAATLASTGTSAYFVHPTEASHGDLGMITAQDALVLLSWSGETAELANMLTYAKRFKVPIISISSNRESTLARNSEIALVLPKVPEGTAWRRRPRPCCSLPSAMLWRSRSWSGAASRPRISRPFIRAASWARNCGWSRSWRMAPDRCRCSPSVAR
ncbi:D-arabinose 5-phosphate isomerase GutQ [Sinorhizobium medicae]|nr:D-arabinose 5-phosphate isomerase GutQ [Sinorhizobium medicae]TWA38192.1 D-arabinose 5-phosphate isomerase GutQ [Sinorhizobium medicae]